MLGRKNHRARDPGAHRRWPALAAIGLAAGAILVLGATLTTELIAPPPSKLILDRRGSYLGEVPSDGELLGFWPLPDALPERIAIATVETEDHRFYRHRGVSLLAIGRALRQNLAHLRVVSGGSTIPMQVARMQSPGARHLWNKLRESLEALILVQRHGHDRVLRHYLTIAPYGNRVRGAARAARYYFDKPLEDLSWLQAAYLAGLPQAPGRLNPHHGASQQRGLQRAHRILRRLHQRGRLGADELQQALASDLRLVPRPARRPEALHAVLDWSELVRGRPDAVTTATLDLDLQQQVAQILERNLRRLRWLHASNTAGLVIDTAAGDILAYVGSADYFGESERGAINYGKVKRSPGSALKPFIYALALERGFTAASELEDTPMDFVAEAGRAYLPRNIGGRFMGPLLLRPALGNSRNIPALRLLSTVGIEPVLSLLEAAGVRGISYQPDAYGLGMALGNLHLTAEELAAVYLMLANGGESVPLRWLADEPVAPRRRLLERGAAQQIRNILADDEARAPSFRRGGPLEYDYAAAVKTGTSQGFRDAWAVAFSDRALVVVWVGNHDCSSMNRITGARGAAAAAHEMLDLATSAIEPWRAVAERFAPPPEYVAATVCSLSGLLAGPDCPHPAVEHFAPGSEPVKVCPFHRRVRVDRRNGLLASADCPRDLAEERLLLDLPERYEVWARQQRLELAPREPSPLCGPPPFEEPQVRIVSPPDNGRYLWDPDTPVEFATLRFEAQVRPRAESIVWLVDGVPVAQVGYPHQFRWQLTPGRHVVQASMAQRPARSQPITVTVVD
ncbi:MAG: transglycosylase domain-containing protein [Deltaproteobacteria bacterium]|nr:transglycosylase domain-containing protein [Deltaproteobacteria bacterium]